MEIPDFLVPTGEIAGDTAAPVYKEFMTLHEAVKFAKELCTSRGESVPVIAPIRVVKPRIECDVEERNNFRNAPDV